MNVISAEPWRGKLIPVVTVALLLAGCRSITPPQPAPLSNPPPVSAEAPSLVRLAPEQAPDFTDDADTASLRTAAQQSAAYYRTLAPEQSFRFADETYTASALASSMDAFVTLLDQAKTPEEWRTSLALNFVVYQSVGSGPDKTVTFSSYYEPTMPARLTQDAHFRYPIYGRPSDLVTADLGSFNPAYQGAQISGRLRGQSLVPYYTRGDIDSKKILSGQQLEIAYAQDPLDIFFLQIEGSGWLDTGNGMVRIRYDGNNGRAYRSLGVHMIKLGRVKAKGFGHDALVRYMKNHPGERQELMNYDERYIFFRIDMSSMSAYAFGNLSEPLTPDRSIATDPKVFPKGALAWIQIPSLDAHTGMTKMARFVLNQDEGSAIQGPGRVDFFAGHGAQAEQFATHLWNSGKLYFLVKKK